MKGEQRHLRWRGIKRQGQKGTVRVQGMLWSGYAGWGRGVDWLTKPGRG